MTRFPRRLLPALVAALATATAASTASAAPATTIACGQTITTSIRLADDVLGCPDEGLVIGADDITVDLNGHIIAGDGASVADCPPDATCDVGIDDSAGHHHVTVRNGSVRGFDVGATFDGGDSPRLRDLDVTGNLFVGLIVVNAARPKITSNTVSGNGATTDGAGIILFATQDGRVAGNHVSGNGGNGIFVGNSEHDDIVANQIAHHADAGIVNDHSDDDDIAGNQISGGDGMVVVGDHNRVAANQVSDTTHCADAGCGHGISFEGGTGNVIEHNTVTNTAEAGINVAAFEPDTPPAIDNTVQDNDVAGSATDGILVEATATRTLVQRNESSDNADDGIEVDNTDTTLTSNTADANGDLGIEAIAGVFDGGRNRAAGNGNPAGCLNVSCR
jgi:parallel beta-helix repeat protein